MKYIFVTGAPGSKWSSVVKNIYYSSSIDRTDYSHRRTYYHDASGTRQIMHLGAYFDPGMEFGDDFDRLEHMTRERCEAEFDRPFSGVGIRIIKSHVFAHKIDFLKKTWPESPIIMVLRDDDACLGWWVRCGHFDITYPDYQDYYKDLRHMAWCIDSQNRDIRDAWDQHDGFLPRSNHELCDLLGIRRPPEEYHQEYHSADVAVKII